MSRGRVLILQHEPTAPPGNFGDWAEARGFTVEVLMSADRWDVPDLAPYSFVGTLGSAAHAYDDGVAWLARELEFLATAHASTTPVCGICFGSQSLARSLGAETRLNDELEVGWLDLDLAVPTDLPRGPWFFWHEDRFAVPASAELLASTPLGPSLYRTEKDWGIQFHPEVGAESLEHWIRISGGELDAATLAAIRRNLQTEPEAARERAWALYDAFLADTAGD